jgi:hypothetical protein
MLSTTPHPHLVLHAVNSTMQPATLPARSPTRPLTPSRERSRASPSRSSLTQLNTLLASDLPFDMLQDTVWDGSPRHHTFRNTLSHYPKPRPSTNHNTRLRFGPNHNISRSTSLLLRNTHLHTNTRRRLNSQVRFLPSLRWRARSTTLHRSNRSLRSSLRAACVPLLRLLPFRLQLSGLASDTHSLHDSYSGRTKGFALLHLYNTIPENRSLHYITREKLGLSRSDHTLVLTLSDRIMQERESLGLHGMKTHFSFLNKNWWYRTH